MVNVRSDVPDEGIDLVDDVADDLVDVVEDDVVIVLSSGSGSPTL